MKKLDTITMLERTRNEVCACGSELNGRHDHTTCGPPVPRDPPFRVVNCGGGRSVIEGYDNELGRCWYAIPAKPQDAEGPFEDWNVAASWVMDNYPG